MTAPTITVCRCGQYMSEAPNGLLYCEHCDKHCPVDRNKFICPRCDQFSAVWKEIMGKTYGPGKETK